MISNLRAGTSPSRARLNGLVHSPRYAGLRVLEPFRLDFLVVLVDRVERVRVHVIPRSGVSVRDR